MVKKRILVVVTILILLVVAAGCGGQVTQTAAAPTTQTTATPEKTTVAPTTTTATSEPTPTKTSAPTTTTVVEIQPTETPEPTETQEPEPTEVVFTLTSPFFGYGEAMPSRYSLRGGNKSPELDWIGAPEGTVSFALIMEDPDGGMWSHWVIFNMASDITGLGEDIPKLPTVGDNTKQGTNDFLTIGYGGPSPPSGTHRYYLRLYALDKMLDLASGATRQQVITAMQGHILGEAEYMGTYSA